MVTVAKTLTAMREHLAPWRSTDRICLVPTMGALHAGHLGLVQRAKETSARVVVSIFVNPAQFAPHEDLARYPRDLEGDLEMLSAQAVDLVYAPTVAEMYPNTFATDVSVAGPATGLESDFRPHFFRGVATVLTKLFLQVRPDFTVFGEKDFQQLRVVIRLVKDLDLGIEVIGMPTMREPDGLALSSRNVFLTPEQRRTAPALHRQLIAIAAERDGLSTTQLEAQAAAGLLSAGFDRVDYVAIRDPETLGPLRHKISPARVLAAAWLGKTRLIDNVPA